jgi:hypothetical protein
MKTMLNFMVAAILLVAGPSTCFALMGIRQVSKEEAKELGIEVRVQGNGPREVWITLELKNDSKLKDFSHVSLEIREEGKLLVGYAAMQEKKSETGRTFTFMANRAFLEKITLSVVTGFPSNYSGNELRMKDFGEVGKIR